MNANDLTQAKDPDVRAALSALRRAAQMARKTVMQTSTHLVIVKNGRLQRIGAAELARQEATIAVLNMTEHQQLGNTLWSIADPLRGAMGADDFRDCMLSFLFLRDLSDNYETAAKKERAKDDPDVGGTISKQAGRGGLSCCSAKPIGPFSPSRAARMGPSSNRSVCLRRADGDLDPRDLRGTPRLLDARRPTC
jgi:hypothetical protein